MQYAGLELLRHANESDAREVLNRGIDWFNVNTSPPRPIREIVQYTNLPVLLSAYRLAGRTAEAATYVSEVALTTFSPFAMDTLGILGLLAADRGDRTNAIALLDRLRATDDPRYPRLAIDGTSLVHRAPAGPRLQCTR